MIPSQMLWKAIKCERNVRISNVRQQIYFRNASSSSSNQHSSSSMNSAFLQVLDPVRQALEDNKPVVALESTIVAHGMPYPENLQLSQRLAAILRDKGVEPATIAVRGTSLLVLVLNVWRSD